MVYCNCFHTKQHRRISRLYPVLFLFITVLAVPIHSWSLVLPSSNISRRNPSLCRKSYRITKRQWMQQDDSNDSDEADTSSSATDEKNVSNEAKYNQDDNDTKDSSITDASDVDRSTMSGVESRDSNVVSNDVATSTNNDNMTDRFKYKVNALMGAFDPIDSSKDTEATSGNILNALLKFPVSYTFHVVGKTSGDDLIKALFVEQVKSTMIQSSSTPILMDHDDEDIRYEITERGTKYTKVSIQKEVINAEEITHIYDQLSKLELSVMQF